MEFGEFAGTWFIAMEYLHGVPLSRMMTRLSKAGKMLDHRVVAGIIVQACEGLHAAHEAKSPDGTLLNVVHRDVSPPNIMVTSDGIVKLLDFGIAKARGANSRTRTGTVKGKNAYMSPEQILGKPLDRRSDVFALAIVMYEMLAIKRLFHRDSDFLTFKAITEEPIPDIRDRRPDMPASLVAVLNRALARDPAGRFATAAAMKDAIIAACATLGGPATPDEIKAMLARDFADELAAKDALVKEAERLDADAAPLTGPGASHAPTPVANIRELAADDGDFLDRTPVAKGGRVAASPGPSASVFITPPPSSLATAPAGIAMVDLADPSTDLLRDRRRRAVRLTIAIAAVLAIAGLAYVLGRGSGAAPKAAPAVAAAAPVDAGVAPLAADLPDAAIDADQTRADIAALARYGFFSIGSDKKAVIFIDHQRIKEAPLIRYLLEPGPHQIKAVGPKGKTKRWDIIIEATKDVDLGVIEW
jgi:hypothetical protein